MESRGRFGRCVCYRTGMTNADGVDYTPTTWETRRDVARRARVSTKTVDNWVRAGRLKRYGTGRVVRFDPADVDRLIRESQ